MNDAEPAPGDTTADFSFDIRFLETGKRSVMLFLPQSFHASIGLIVAYWGNFEVLFDQCLAALLEAEQTHGRTRDAGKWKTQSFNRRSRLFRQVCEDWKPRKPEAASRFLNLLDTAVDLQLKRNMIAHGTYSYRLLPMSSTASACYAYSERSSRKILFDEGILKKLYHDISHLTADLLEAFQKIGSIDGYPFRLVQDDALLRLYRETVHPWNPDPSLRPASSQQEGQNSDEQSA